MLVEDVSTDEINLKAKGSPSKDQQQLVALG